MKLLFLILVFLLIRSPMVLAQDQADTIQTDMAHKDYYQAFHTTQSDAQRGDPQAEGDLGLMYEKGLGTTQNAKKAAFWFGEGARNGDADSENNLGYLYFHGQGVPQNYSEALKWFQKAADQGLASAEENLGLMYGAGLGVKIDYKKSMAFYTKAAEQDDLISQINLGQMYSLGEGAPENYITSYFWFYLALEHVFNNEEKKNEIRNDIEWLEKRMTNEDIDKAKRDAMQWRPTINSVSQNP